MKNIFMPPKDGLKKMQELGADVYSYILIKTIETLIADGINLSAKGILNPNTTYKYILEDPEIVLPICKLYPELINMFDYAKNDSELCLELLDKDTTYSECTLDKMIYFDENLLCSNRLIIEKVVKLLALELTKNPKYRFTYQPSTNNGKNILLDKILSTTLISDESSSSLAFSIHNSELIKNLSLIEPYYAIKLDDSFYSSIVLKDSEIPLARQQLLINSVESYKKRYGINNSNPYSKEDIISKPNEKVKRLLRNIKINDINLY